MNAVDDWLSSDIEASVQNNGDVRQIAESADELVIEGMLVLSYGLHTCAAIHMGDGRE